MGCNPSREISPERELDFDRVWLDSDPGDAFRACIASILRTSREEVPISEHGGLSDKLRMWLSTRHRSLHVVQLYDEYGNRWRLPPEEDISRWAGELGVLHGTSPKGQGEHGHDVVARIRADGTLTIVHDPHP